MTTSVPMLQQNTSNRAKLSSENDHVLTRDLTPCKDIGLFFALTLRSLGIIFGDIGTSPLYVINTVFTEPPTETQLVGAISLIIWNLIVSVTIKYGVFILMADHHGEGGTFALCGLLSEKQSTLSPRAKKVIIIVGLIGASLLIGDGALTPAVSVLSAIEGIAVEAPHLEGWILPITAIILILFFLAQRWGTSKIGATFGPIMFIWFSTLFSVGIWRISYHPSILKAFNPWEAFQYFLREKKKAFYQIGDVFLAVTGLEALYADLGHFGKWPIRFSWFFVVFPAVTANYLGQGALLIGNPNLIDNPFYHSIPDWFHWPMVVLATVATLIASQAIVTGSFSLIGQAIALECAVPFKIIYTSKTIIGQIYVPAINFILMILTIAVTLGFKKSSNITNAYGVTVCSVMIITIILYMCVMRFVWHKKIYFILPFILFLILDSFTWAANSVKIPSGGWVALAIGSCFFTLGFSWYFGQLQLRRFLKIHAPTTDLKSLPSRLGLANNNGQNSSPILSVNSRTNQMNVEDESDSDSDTDTDTDFKVDHETKLRKVPSEVIIIKDASKPISHSISCDFQNTDQNINGVIPAAITPGVGCFLTTSKKYTPHVFENFLCRSHAIPQILIFLQVKFVKRPTIPDEKRIIVKAYGENIYHITALHGYSENYIEPFDILSRARNSFEVPIPDDEMSITIFMEHDVIEITTGGWRSWIRRWPLYIYSIMKGLYPGAAMDIQIKPENTIHVGILAKLK